MNKHSLIVCLFFCRISAPVSISPIGCSVFFSPIGGSIFFSPIVSSVIFSSICELIRGTLRSSFINKHTNNLPNLEPWENSKLPQVKLIWKWLSHNWSFLLNFLYVPITSLSQFLLLPSISRIPTLKTQLVPFFVNVGYFFYCSTAGMLLHISARNSQNFRILQNLSIYSPTAVPLENLPTCTSISDWRVKFKRDLPLNWPVHGFRY